MSPRQDCAALTAAGVIADVCGGVAPTASAAPPPIAHRRAGGSRRAGAEHASDEPAARDGEVRGGERVEVRVAQAPARLRAVGHQGEGPCGGRRWRLCLGAVQHTVRAGSHRRRSISAAAATRDGEREQEEERGPDHGGQACPPRRPAR